MHVECVFGHTERVVLVCCEHVNTFVPEIIWRVTNDFINACFTGQYMYNSLIIDTCMSMLWFNFILGLNFISLCFGLW